MGTIQGLTGVMLACRDFYVIVQRWIKDFEKGGGGAQNSVQTTSMYNSSKIDRCSVFSAIFSVMMSSSMLV